MQKEEAIEKYLQAGYRIFRLMEKNPSTKLGKILNKTPF